MDSDPYLTLNLQSNYFYFTCIINEYNARDSPLTLTCVIHLSRAIEYRNFERNILF